MHFPSMAEIYQKKPLSVPRSIAARVTHEPDGRVTLKPGGWPDDALDFAERVEGLPTALPDGRIVFWTAAQGLTREPMLDLSPQSGVDLAGLSARLRRRGWPAGSAVFRCNGDRLFHRWTRHRVGAPLVLVGGIDSGPAGEVIARFALSRRSLIEIDPAAVFGAVSVAPGGFIARVRVDDPTPGPVKAVLRAAACGAARVVLMTPRAWVPSGMRRMVGLGAAVVEVSDELVEFGRSMTKAVMVVDADVLALARIIGAASQDMRIFIGRDKRPWHVSLGMRPRRLSAKLLRWLLISRFRFVGPSGSPAAVPAREVLSAVIGCEEFLSRLEDLYRGPERMV